MATQAKTITIDHEDVISSTSVASVSVAVPVTKPSEQPVDATAIDVNGFRKAIKTQFTGSRAVIDHIASLGLTADSVDMIEKLRVIFFDTWPELIYGKLGATATEARASREALYSTKGADRTSDQTKVYDATKSAWKWVKEQCDLKAAPRKRASNAGTGATAPNEKETTIDPAKVTSFEELAQLALDCAKLMDLIASKATQAKIKSAGLIPAMQDMAKALRVQVTTSRDGLK